MADLADGESREVKGSGSRSYVLENKGGVYSCSCPAWRNQSFAIERRTCKHLKAFRGDEVERARTGGPIAKANADADADANANANAKANANANANAKEKEKAKANADAKKPPLLLAHTWENDVDLAGWWMSEKLDGVRAYWDGKRLISRLGNTFLAPAWFTERLPTDMALDGELFGGRKQFQRTVSIVRRQDRGDAWKEITFLVFDAPNHAGEFEARLLAVAEMLNERALGHVRPHMHEPCRGLEHLREELARVEALGGEGLMLRKPGSRYESGRSSTLLKVKTFHDTEAIVVAYKPGEGRHKGRVGALECDLADGTRFSVGTGLSDHDREHPPAIGAVITFRFQELSNEGVPRFPSYVGVRDDISWPPSITKQGTRRATQS